MRPREKKTNGLSATGRTAIGRRRSPIVVSRRRVRPLERMLQRREPVIGFYRRWRHGGRYLRQSGRAGSRRERTDTSGTYVSQRSSRRTVHHSTHVMTQLRWEMSQGMRVTLKARVDHTNGMRKTGGDPMNFAHIVTDARVQAVLHTARR